MKVAILMGGKSTTGDAAAFDASRAEANAVAAALEQAKHTAVLIEADATWLDVLAAQRPDICYIAAGTQGACDGSLQSVLEMLGIPFIGSSSRATRLASDMELAEYELQRYAEASEDVVNSEPLMSVYVSEEAPLCDDSYLNALVDRCEKRIPGGYPFEVVSLAQSHNEDSASAITVYDRKACVTACGNALAYGPVLIRQWVEGARLSVVVLGTGWDAQVLAPVEEVAPQIYEAPPRSISLAADDADAQAVRLDIERCVFEACLALGIQDFAVLDVIWDGSLVRLLNIDPFPSVTEGSVFETACKTAGLSVEGVLDHLVRL